LTGVLFYIVLLAIALGLVLAPLVLSLVAYARSRRIVELTRRVNGLEALVRELRRTRPEAVATPPAEPATPSLEPAIPPPVVAPQMRPVAPRRAAAVPAFDLESFIGRRALGWVAVVLIIFAAAFFLRYAFENNWIGPIGRVALAAIGGLVLVGAGWHYHKRPGWRIFSQMLTSAGVVLFYLGTYSAFGFYRLLSQRSAAIFLLIQACLGLRIDASAARLYLDNPQLPESVEKLDINNLKVASGVVDVSLVRHAEDVAVNVRHRVGKVEVVVIH